MWVVYGTPERIPGDDDHAYNSAFAISPEGKVSSYQKIAPVEGAWATPGTTPVIPLIRIAVGTHEVGARDDQAVA